MKINESFDPLTKEALREFEHRIGRKIPLSYRTFLLSKNGGRPERTDFSFFDQNGKAEPCSVQFFLGLNPSIRSLGLEYTLDVFGEELTDAVFPIARDPGGNIICIGTTPKTDGKVFFWDHEIAPPQPNVSFVSDTFNDFLALLK